MDNRRLVEQRREEEYRGETNEVAESVAIMEDEDHTPSL